MINSRLRPGHIEQCKSSPLFGTLFIEWVRTNFGDDEVFVTSEWTILDLNHVVIPTIKHYLLASMNTEVIVVSSINKIERYSYKKEYLDQIFDLIKQKLSEFSMPDLYAFVRRHIPGYDDRETLLDILRNIHSNDVQNWTTLTVRLDLTLAELFMSAIDPERSACPIKVTDGVLYNAMVASFSLTPEAVLDVIEWSDMSGKEIRHLISVLDLTLPPHLNDLIP